MLPIVKQCNFNQNQGYLLISYALYVALTIFVNMQTCIHEFEASSHVKWWIWVVVFAYSYDGKSYGYTCSFSIFCICI